MSRGLLILLGAAAHCVSPHALAAATNNNVWQLGVDDARTSPFRNESYRSNVIPGSPEEKDDDFYFAGIYPDPIGTLTEPEEEANVERALTSSDPRNRIHFPLSQDLTTSSARLRLTVDLFGGGGWDDGSLPGFQSHNVSIRFNGHTIEERSDINFDTTLIITFPASSVAATTGENVIEIERSGGSEHGYIQLDYIRLDADPTALRDDDNDGLPLWFETTYGLDDDDSSDAPLDHDSDGLDARAELLAGTNPTDPDSDNDGLLDGEESDTSPLLFDTDGDGLSDGKETLSDPAIADTDDDSFPDNIEIEQGSDPRLASSTPFPFAGSIGLQFVSERSLSLPLDEGDPAGLFRFPHWNNTHALPRWPTDEEPLENSLSGLVDSRGQVTTAAASWSYRYSTEGRHRGRSDERLLSGMIVAANNDLGSIPIILNLSGIPFTEYDLIVYVGDSSPSHRGKVHLGRDGSTNRYFVSDSSPPFIEWKEITSTSEEEISQGNYIRYRGLSGASQSLTVEQLDSNTVGLHAIQIIETGRDSDGDGISDVDEIEHGLNPSVQDAVTDLDEDGLDNLTEIRGGTDPNHPDSDRDGLIDGDEAGHGADPLDPDSDDDGLADGDEVNGHPFPSLAYQANSDTDEFSDAAERLAGSDPMDEDSTPGPTPTWDPNTRTWRWLLDDFRIRWNHSQSMLGAISRTDAYPILIYTELEDGGWSTQLSLSLRYKEGVLAHRFRAYNNTFHRAENSDWSHSDYGSTDPESDITRALGFSGFGPSDDSHPLRYEFTATQTNSGTNSWTITCTLSHTADPENPVVIASKIWEESVAADPRLIDGSAPWVNGDGEAGAISITTSPGFDVFFSREPLGPADSDTDGMPDSWEETHAFDPLNPADADLDADLDTLSNLQEFLAGSNPHSKDSDKDGASDATEIAHGTRPDSPNSYPGWIDFNGDADDLNRDGLSDAWMLWAGGKPRSAGADDDGDGMSNREESEAGTDPDDPNSLLDLSVRHNNEGLILEWPNLPHKINRLEASASLADWSTNDLPTASVIGATRRVTIPNAFESDSPSRFFRAGVLPLDSDGDGVEDWVEKEVLFSSIDDPDSLGQSMLLSDESSLSGDARALLDRLRSGHTSQPSSPSPSETPPPSRVHASRFLMQATFGPVPEEIEEVTQLGFDAWITHQTTLPPSLLQPYIREIKADAAGPRLDRDYDYNEGSEFVTGQNVTTPWARNAVAAPDQLRQRVAFALSEILVISRRNAQLEQKPEAVTNYYDTLINHAFGSYGELLLEVSLHPAMGWYLSSVGNQKADPSIPRYPDENYAREIMQLFTVGLWELNPDGTRKTNEQGEPIPTYGNADITELARVFTGLYYDSPYGWGGGGWEDSHFLKPMVMHADRHDFDAKRLLNGFVVPAREPSADSGLQDVKDAVNALVSHPSTAPFISRKLIQFLVTDNPSPAYLERVSNVFTNDGSGAVGNLGAVVRAILMDPEARQLPTDDAFGKVREPVIRTMHLGRLFNLAENHPDFVWWNSESNYYGYSFQEPLYSPTVFNFFTPEYQAPGEIRQRGLVSPGFQIIDTYSAISFPNRLWDYLHSGFISSWNGPRYPLDFSSSLLVSRDPHALIDQLDLLVCTGNMSAHTRRTLVENLDDPQLTDQDRLAVALWTVITSPEGAIQR